MRQERRRRQDKEGDGHAPEQQRAEAGEARGAGREGGLSQCAGRVDADARPGYGAVRDEGSRRVIR